MNPSPYEYIPPNEDDFTPHDPYGYKESYNQGYREGMAARGEGGFVGVSDSERHQAIAAHLAGPIAMLLSVGWAGFVGPLVIWLMNSKKGSFARTAAARSFNFNLALWVAILIGRGFRFLVITAPIAWLIWGLVGVIGLICHLWAARRASDGKLFRYPFGIPVLR